MLTFFSARTILFLSKSSLRPWTVVRVFLPLRCWIRMCTIPPTPAAPAPTSPSVFASANASEQQEYTNKINEAGSKVQSCDHFCWSNKYWTVHTTNQGWDTWSLIPVQSQEIVTTPYVYGIPMNKHHTTNLPLHASFYVQDTRLRDVCGCVHEINPHIAMSLTSPTIRHQSTHHKETTAMQ